MGELVFSLVLPAYNEAAALPRAVEAAIKALDGIPFEVIIAEDGSRDGTDKVAEGLAEKHPGIVRHLHSAQKLGRGRALKQAFSIAKGKYVGYMDVDLATNPAHLKELVKALDEGFDVVTGSRYAEGNKSSRSAKRLFLSKGFNGVVRTILGSRVEDHQCGFKGFRREAALKLCALARENHWFWDTEVLVLAQRLGMKVKEIPVEWKEGKVTKVNIKRDVLGMGAAAVKMRLRKY